MPLPRPSFQLPMHSPSTAWHGTKCDYAHPCVEMPQFNMSWCHSVHQLVRCGFHKIQQPGLRSLQLAMGSSTAARHLGKCDNPHLHMETLQGNLILWELVNQLQRYMGFAKTSWADTRRDAQMKLVRNDKWPTPPTHPAPPLAARGESLSTSNHILKRFPISWS